MASYLTQPSIAAPQPFTPNWDFLMKVADASQKRYNENLSRLEGIYGTLLNTPLTHENNIQRRDQFFKQSQAAIDHLASTDLSMPNIYEQASGVFDPLIEDKYIQKDIQWSRVLKDQAARAEGYRNSSDAATRSKYWTEGLMELQIQKERFQKSTLDGTLDMASPRYTPKVDIHGRALEIIKQQYGNDAGIEVDQVTGNWIVTTKNGPLVYPQMRSLIQSQLANDPSIKDMYKTMYNVGEYSFIKENAQMYGSEDAAALAYAEKTLSENEFAVIEAFNGQAIQKQSLRDQIEGDQANIKKNGVVPGTQEHADFQTRLRILAGLENDQEAVESRAVLETPADDIATMRDKAFRAFYLSNLSEASNTEAQMAASVGYKNTVQANPYGVEAVKHSHAVALQNLKHKNDIEFEYFKSTLPGKDGSTSNSGLDLGALIGPGGVQVVDDVEGGTTTSQAPAAQSNGEALNTFEGQIIMQMAEYLQGYSQALGREGVQTKDGLVPFKDLRAMINDPQGRQSLMTAYNQAINSANNINVVKNNPRLAGMQATIAQQASVWGKVSEESRANDLNIYESWTGQSNVAKVIAQSKAGRSFIDRGNGRPVSVEQYITAYQARFGYTGDRGVEDATEEYNDLMENYSEFYNRNSNYSVRAKLFGGTEGMGAGSMSTPGYRTTVNGQVMNASATKMVNELARSLSAASSSGGVVTYQEGGLGTIGSNDPKMRTIYQNIITDLIARQGKDASGAPIFSLQYQAVAGGDANKAGYTITLDSEYAKKWIGPTDKGSLIDEESDFARDLTFSIVMDKEHDLSSYRNTNQKVDGVETSMRSNDLGVYYENGPHNSYLHMRELMDGSVEITQSVGAFNPRTGNVDLVTGAPQVMQLSPGQYEQVRQQWYDKTLMQSQMIENQIRQFKENNGAIKEPSQLK